ncbi:MAG TPA: MopE-related protein [Kofleriaceae bacterium]|nr:MopE-related protein [Kofleriaceae bacterium]
MRAVLLGTICLAACGGDGDAVRLLDLQDGDYVGGLQVSRIDVQTARNVVRAELFLDGLRIAADELAPFDLGWDARAFDEGSHRLTARVHLDDDTQLDGSVMVLIDNTPPMVGEVTGTARVGDPFEVTATDNGKVARVELSRGRRGEAPLVLTSAPFRFTWPWCGALSLEVRVVDAAGGEATRSFPLTGVADGDQDCDGHRSDLLGGDDCDDDDPTRFPGASEGIDDVDHDCDGVPGFVEANDADHDGVAAIAAGGNDCDDSNPAVHGDFYVVRDYPISVGGQPVLWKPGEAVFPAHRASPGELYLNRGGQVEQLLARGQESTLTRVSSDANPGSIAADGSYVAFGRGNQAIIKQATATGWVDQGMIDADAPVGALIYLAPFQGVEYAAYQAGTRMWFASRAGASWTTQLLVDVGAPLAEPPAIFATPGSNVNLTFRTSSAAWNASGRGSGGPLETHRIGPDGMAPTAIGGPNNLTTLVAVDTGAGGALYNDRFSSPVAVFPQRIIRLAGSGSSLFVQLEGLETEVLEIHDSFRKTQSIPNVTAFDSAAGPTFATSGHVFFPTRATVFAPDDPFGDGIDQNCDGSTDF